MRSFFEKLGKLYDAQGALLWGAAALLLIVLVLFGERPVGLSDNGDFRRVMDASSVAFTGNEKAYSYNDTYRIVLGDTSAAGNVTRILFSAEGYAKYPSLQVPLTRLSVVLNLLINKITGGDMTVYRLSVLGALYALLYAGAIFFLAASFRLPRRLFDIAAKALILLVLCDIGYLAYFDSFYGEALQLIAFVVLAALLIRITAGKPGMKEAVWSALACVAFGWCKFFNIPAACAFAVLLEGLILFRTKRITAAVSCAAAIAMLTAVWLSVPNWMGIQTKFNAVFFGALRVESTPSAEADEADSVRYLSELGLPPALSGYRGLNIYVDDVAAGLEQAGLDKAVGSISNARLGLFFLRHPDILGRALDITRLNAGSIRPLYLGNYDGGSPKLTLSHRFSVWSDTRSFLGFDSWMGIAGVALAFGAVLVIALRRAGFRWREVLFSLVLLGGVALYLFAGPFVSNGEGDLTKHLFAFGQMTDLTVLFVLVAALYELSVIKKRKAVIPLLCAFMALSLLYAPARAALSDSGAASRHRGGLESGAFVRFGDYNNNALVWRVTGTEGGVLTLLSTGTIAEAVFSPDDNSAWESSSLRSWLNGNFLRDFSPEDRARIVPSTHEVLLSHETKSEATVGSRDFFFSYVPDLASRGYATAYRYTLQDNVTLPDITLASALPQIGVGIALREPYWLETPYFNNGYMVRCVLPDGTILMREASEACGVRPVIRVAADGMQGGSGTATDPYIID